MPLPTFRRAATPLASVALVALVSCLLFPGCQGAAPPAGAEATIGGNLEEVNEAGIAGWAWDGSKPDTPIQVDLYDGAEKLATVEAGVYREDLVTNKIGNGKHAFKYPLPERLKDGKSHTIHVKVSGTDTELNASPKTVKVETAGGNFEEANEAEIAGWAWDSSKPDTPIQVDIYDGVEKLATVEAGVYREDLVTNKIGNGKHGFKHPLPERLKDGKSHTIHVKISGTDTELANSPKTFKTP